MSTHKAYLLAASVGIVMISFLVVVMYEAQKVLAG